MQTQAGTVSVTSDAASAFSWNAKSGYRQDGVAPTGISTAYSFQKVGDRYYDPTLMCFLTRDTELGQLPYTYCGGEPVNRVDPTGHYIVILFIIVAGVLLYYALKAKPQSGRPTNHSPLWQ